MAFVAVLVIAMVASGFAAMASADITSEGDVKATSATIYVPDNYTKIQWAIDNATVGNTIIVNASGGPYYENLVVDKQLSLIGIGLPEINANGSGSAIHVTSDGCLIERFHVTGGGIGEESGISVESYGNIIRKNHAFNNKWGIYFKQSSNNKVIDNIANSNTWDGIVFDDGCDNNIVDNNTASDNYIGMLLWSSNNTLRNNTMNSNYHNFNIYGIINDIDTSNKVNGKPIYYWVYENDRVVPNDAGFVGVVNSRNITVKNLTLKNNGRGVMFANTTDSIIENVSAQNNWHGIVLSSSGNNTIINNTASNNQYGIGLDSSINTILINNTVNSNIESGIFLHSSISNTFTNNIMNSNSENFGIYGRDFEHFNHNIDRSNMLDGKPIYYLVNEYDQIIQNDAGFVGVINSRNITVRNLTLKNNWESVLFAYTLDSIMENVSVQNSYYGIRFHYSNNNTLANNKVSKNIYGIDMYHSNNNTIKNNNVSLNMHDGIQLGGSNNLIFHNNFADNSPNAWDGNPADNDWYHPNLLEGNYWSDYAGVDDGSGTGKHAIAGDGIGDTHIPHPGANYDNYPFMQENGWITTNCSPGWHGTVIIDCENLDNWSVEFDIGSNGNLTLVPGFIGKAVQLNWSLGSGGWVQGKSTFPEPINLSNYDIFGVSLHGSDSTPNCVSLMFADTHDVFYGWDFDGTNSIDRWMKNLAVPRKLFYKFWDWNTTDEWDEIDWSNINRFFFVVKCPSPTEGGGSGQLTIDHLQADRAQQWNRQDKFHTSTGDPDAARKAVEYILSQQKATGLFLSWKEEPFPKAWLYDQALVLRVLTREGTWVNGNPTNNESSQADKLVNFIANQQMEDGHWHRCWNPETGDPLSWDGWVGDQAWMTFALQTYRLKSGNDSVEPIINNASVWLKNKINTSTGKVVNSTEGNVDVWWAMIATGNIQEAEQIEEYLLSIWDGSLKYWPRGSNDSFVAIDCQTWLSHFARSPWVNEEEKGMEALSFARRTLVTTNENDTICGFDGMGPVSVWCEGTAQYLAAGGEDSQLFMDNLMSIQNNTDGSLPGCPDKKTWESCFGWLSPWSGLAPTAWFYFAITGDPFISTFDTGPGTYPSIFGIHNGTIIPNTDIFVHRMFTYSCSGTGGHSEYVKIWNETWNATANWTGYKGDWHNISFDNSFILEKGKIYNYTIRTGSYPQIKHKQNYTTIEGSLITCEELVDANGKKYNDWIPAIKLFFS